MVEEASLSLSIDSRDAKRGADEFCRAAEDIKAKAADMGQAVENNSLSFQKLGGAANNNLRPLADTARSLRDVETAVSGLSRSSGEVKSLSDQVVKLGEGAGVSAKVMSGLVIAFEAIAAAFTVANIAKQAIKVGSLVKKFGVLGSVVRIAGAAIAGLTGVFVGAPILVTATAVSALAVSYGLLAKNTNEATTNTRRFRKATNAAKEFLTTPEQRRQAQEKAEKEKVIGAIDVAIAEIEAKINSLSKKIEERTDQIKTERELHSGEQLETIVGLFNTGTAKLIAQRDAQVEEREGLIAKRQAVENKPLVSISSEPSLDIGALINQLQEAQAVVELESSFKALENSIDPLGAATRAYAADLELLQAAEEAGLITKSQGLELADRLANATLDARDPVAALRRELEEERKQILLTDDEREVSIRLLEVEARLKMAGVDASSQTLQALEKEIRAIQKLRQERENANEAEKKIEEDRKRRQQDADDEKDRRDKAVEDTLQEFRDIAKDSFKDVIKGTKTVAEAFEDMANRITDKLIDLALDEIFDPGNTGFSDLLSTLTGGLGGGGAGIIGGLFSGGGANSLVDFATAGAGGAGLLIGHKGGVVGSDSFPMRRFHDGGIAGLRPDEVPAILQRGEEILTRSDPRHAANQNSAGGQGNNFNVTVQVSGVQNPEQLQVAAGRTGAKLSQQLSRFAARNN